MKKSKFCVVKEMEDAIILANLRSGYLIKFVDTYIDVVKRILDNDGLEENNISVFKFLVDKGFLVEEKLDEDIIEKEEIERAKNNDGKLGLIIMPTDDCNFRCPYCYEDHEKRYMSRDYLDKIVRFVDKNIDKYEGLKVEWFGGEPLLQLDSVFYLSEKLMDICKRHKKPFIAGMTTNGYFLTVDVFQRLRKLHFLGYQITVDGLAQSHDKQRFLVNGEGSWNVIVKNLRDIRDTPCRGFTNITIRSNFTADMLATANEFLLFLKKEFGHDRRFHYFIRTVADFGGERIHEMDNQLIKDKTAMIQLQKNASSLGLRLKIQENNLSAGGMICYANQRNHYTLGSDEKVRKSTCEYNNPLNHIGYINDEGDMIIDRKKEELWVNGYSCSNKKCNFRITCGGDGCPDAHVFAKTAACVWNAGSIEEVLEILSYNENVIGVYKDEEGNIV